ncbi:MAG: tetratricopeptide repeat protein [Candidatus Midichloriaceae bacterium]
MDVLDEIRDDINKERFVNFLQNYGRYVAILVLFVFIGFIAYFWWNNYKNNVLLEEASEYSDAMNSNDKGKISKLEKLKTKKTVYSDLAKLQLAAYYFNNKDSNRAIHNYELLVGSKNTDKIYQDYAKLMIIKIKILSEKVNSEDAIAMYEDFYKNAEYFNNLAVLGESILLINKGEKYKVSSRLNEILTDNESPYLLMNLAKIIDKRIQQ